MSAYTPAQVVHKTGFGLDTLRYYEKIGLLSGVERTAAGQRRYTDEHVEWLGTIGCLRDTGMPIAQMLRFAELVRAGEHTIAERIALLREHDERVGAQIATLRDHRRYIKAKIEYYERVRS